MKFFKCPCCNKLHFTRLNRLSLENKYKTLQDYSIKKRTKCNRCHSNLAILKHNNKSETKIIWEEFYKVYDDAYQKQQCLMSEKEQILDIIDENEKQKQLEIILKKIRRIQSEASTSQSKLRIKARVTTPEASEGIGERLSLNI
tara:strand:- start:468 stop:899 length:432 start_codon:yes stop_codon:yes gene_type:complete